MADDGSDITSLSSNPSNGVRLFPSLGNTHHHSSGESSKSVSSLSETGTRTLFGFWERSRANEDIGTSSPDSENGDFADKNLRGTKLSANSFEARYSGVNTQEKVIFPGARDHGNELSRTPDSASGATSGSTGEKSIFNERVLQALGSRLAVDHNDDNAMPKSKFPFVKMYEEAFRALKQPGPSSQSVFEVSGLDEYNQFIKLSELDQQIKDNLAPHSMSKSNVLPVLEAADFHKLYNHQSFETPAPRAKKRFAFSFPWHQKRSAGGTLKPSRSDDESAQSILPSSSEAPEQRAYLHRKLEVRHLQMISLGGTLGVGLYLNTGKAISIAGGLGTILAMLLVGLVVFATVISFCEMVTFVSVVDGVSGLSSRFVDESFGFATGWLYFFSFSFGLAGEIVAAVIILSYYPETEILANAGSTAGFVTLFLAICLVSNILSVRVFGEIEYFCSLIKVIITLLGIIIMIVVNRGGIGDKDVLGFKYWTRSQSDFEHNLIFGPFRPSFDLLSDGTDPESQGIGGNGGRFLSLLVAIVVASYAYSGTEIVCIAACEAKDPRKALPSATNRVFWRILILYCLSSFVVSLNIYAGDPRLLRYYTGKTGVLPNEFDDNYAINHLGGSHCSDKSRVVSGYSNGSQSPWVIAFQTAGACGWSSVVNAFLFFFALSCGISQLYVSSRTVYSLALQRKAPGILRKCNKFGTPYMAVLFASLPGLLSYTCVSSRATTVFQNLTSLISSSGVFVWFAMCLSFVRFYFGLKKRPDIIGRDDKSYPYRSALQPYSAIFGLFGSSVILLAMGFVVFLKDCWNTWFFFSSYGTLMIFAALYLGHWFINGTSISSLEALDFDSGRREKDIYIWDGGKEYNLRKVKDLAHKIVDWMA